MDLQTSIRDLLNELGSSQITRSAYDTAWVARLSGLDIPLGEQALEWLREHQLEDGSWGAESPLYHHDRVICTLAAVVALAQKGAEKDRIRWQRGISAFETHVKNLKNDLLGYTVGFEMLLPALLAEAEKLGIIHYQNQTLLDKLVQRRQAKLTALSGKINRFVTVAFSTEMVGDDGLNLLDIENLQQANGSVSYSPAATAFFVLYVRKKDPAGLAYLQNISINGAVPYVTPIEVFEYTWPLTNLALIGHLNDELLTLCQPYLKHLEREWKPGKGIAACSGLTLEDGDDTSLTYQALHQFNRQVDIEAVLSYEDTDHFRCYKFEADPSLSTNIHVMGALRLAGFKTEHSSMQKVLKFLQRKQIDKTFWLDKWHTSPYYPSTHAIIACAGYHDKLINNAVDWLLTTQNEDGSWGYYMPTAEETAYCLQALLVWKRCGRAVSDDVLKRAAAWLADNIQQPYPPLWIGKCLYTPILPVRSAILSALMMAEQG